MNGKITFIISIIALASTLGSFLYLNSSDELVYVDVNKLMDGYKRTAVAKKEFEAKAGILKANADSLLVDWQNELKIYEKERSSMSTKELELKQELLSSKQQQINNYQQAVQKQIQKEDQKVSQTVINDINDFVKEYGKKHGHEIIFGANGGGNVMYARDSANLTDEILEELNNSYEGK